MLRILEASDLHLEHGRVSRIPALPDASTYDVVALPGDLGVGCEGLMWMLAKIPEDKPVIFIPGNHEYYKQDYFETKINLQVFAQQVNKTRAAEVHVLNPGIVEIDNVVIIGATLWSSLELQGYYDHRITDLYIERSIADFPLIRMAGERRTADHHRADHLRERAYITDSLKQHDGTDKKVIVMTHFVPSQICIDPIYGNSPLNPYFTVDMDDLMLDYKIDAWYFGHTHSQMEKVHPSGTRLICNPMGYPGEHNKEEWVIHSY